MCQKCADAVKLHYPDLPDADYGDFLMSTTAFPFGCGDTVERQVREMREATDGSIAAAYKYAHDEFKKDCASLPRGDSRP